MLDFLFASLMGALFIVIVMILRKFMREKYRSGMIMILWGVVLLRLLIPFNPLGANAPVTLSVLDRGVVDTPTEQQDPAAMFPAEQADKPDVRSEIEDPGGQAKRPHIPAKIGNPIEEQGQHQPEDVMMESEAIETSFRLSHKLVSFVKQLTLVEILFYVWLAGALVSVLYLIFVRISFMRTIHDGIVRLEKDEIFKFVPANIPVYVTDKEFGPLVVGPLKPYLIVPRSLISKKNAEDKKERQKLQLALQHEVMHIRRKDLWVKALYLVARSIHWFNPLVWFMGDLLNQDIEYACDEALTLDLSKEEKVDYCQALLDLVKTGSVKSDNFSSRFTGDAEILKTRINKIIHGPRLKRGRTIALSLALMMAISLIVVSCSPKTQGSTSTGRDVSITTPDNKESAEPDSSSVKPDPSESSGKDTDPSQSGSGTDQPANFRLGYWYGESAIGYDRKVEFLFTDDRKYKIDRQTSMLPYKLYGTYCLEGDSVIMTSNGDDGTLTFKIKGDKLVLTEQDLITTLFPDHYTLERGDHSSRVAFTPEEEEEFSNPVFFRDPQAFLVKPDLLAEPNHFSYPEPTRKIGSILYFADYKGFFGFDLNKNQMVHAVQITDPNFPTATQGDYIRAISISKDGKKLLLMPLFPQFRNSNFSGLTTWGFVRPYWYEYDLETQTLERNTGSYDELIAIIKERGEDEKGLWQQYEWKSDTPPTSYQDAVLIGPDGKTYKPFESLFTG